MSLPLNEQAVLVTGAGRGLGAAIATAFAREGAGVAVNYRNSAKAAGDLAPRLGGKAQTFGADVRDGEAVAQMVADVTERLGAPTTIVHNALADFSFNGDARTKLDP